MVRGSSSVRIIWSLSRTASSALCAVGGLPRGGLPFYAALLARLAILSA